MSKIPANVKDLIERVHKDTQSFAVKLEQVAGKGRILEQLNKKHIAALNVLLADPKKISKLKSVDLILDREKKVLNIFWDALCDYINNLDTLKNLCHRYAKRKLLRDINLVDHTARTIRDGIESIQKRIRIEETLLAAIIFEPQHKYVQALINNLENEKDKIEKMIRKSKPGKLIKIRSELLAIPLPFFATEKMQEMEDFKRKMKRKWEEYVKGNKVKGDFFRLVNEGISYDIAAITDSLINVVSGFRLEDKELRAEIEFLQSKI